MAIGLSKLPKPLSVKTGNENKKSGMTVRIIITVITLFICTFLFFYHFNQQRKEILFFNVVNGSIWPKDVLKAEFTFPVFKDEYQYRKEISEARKKCPPVFMFNDQAESVSFNWLGNIFEYLNQLTVNENRKTTEIKQNPKTITQNVITPGLQSFINEPAVKDFLKSATSSDIKELKALEKNFKKFLSICYHYGILDKELSSISVSEISVRYDVNIEKILQKAFLYDLQSARDKAKEMIEDNFPENFLGLIKDIENLVIKSNLIYSPELSEKTKEIAEQSVTKTVGIVHEGDIIVDKGERITDEILSKLSSYQHSRLSKKDTDNSFMNLLGGFGHAVFIYAIFIIYLIILRKRIFYDNAQYLLLSFLLILISAVAWLSVQIPSKFPIEYLIFIPAISMLTAIMFDSRTAFYFTVTISLMIAGIRGNDYDTGVAMMFAGILGAYTVRDIQSRTQIFKSIFFIEIGFIVSIISFGFERSIGMDQILWKIVVSFINSILSPIITFGLLFVFEKMTNITSDLKLEEYNNLNNPLLVKMNELAPGTYQHTLHLAVLAERCAVAIGGNRLLARVGALYHDLGKITKPEYFIENQIEIEDKHKLMSPRRSAEAIRSHVTEGVKIAKEYKLPQKIADFIPMHHGTFLIKHFYAKALEESPGEHILEADFRYPGPKPNSKEAAIVMICDSAEALSRLVANDKEELDKAIEKTIVTRLQDGQFDECDITLKDLHIIKETCIKNLFGVSHQRVEYKEIPGEKQ